VTDDILNNRGACLKMFERALEVLVKVVELSKSGALVSAGRTHRLASFMKATRDGDSRFFDSGQRAEIIRLDAEDRIELAAKVLERDHRGQFTNSSSVKCFLRRLKNLAASRLPVWVIRSANSSANCSHQENQASELSPSRLLKKVLGILQRCSESALSSSKERTNESENY
jgi:hypothetical protein